MHCKTGERTIPFAAPQLRGSVCWACSASGAFRRVGAGRTNAPQLVARPGERIAAVCAVRAGFAFDARVDVAAAKGAVCSTRLSAANQRPIADGGLAIVGRALGAVAGARLACGEAAVAAGPGQLAASAAHDILLPGNNRDAQARIRFAALAGTAASLLTTHAIAAARADLALLARLAGIAVRQETVDADLDLPRLTDTAAVIGADFAFGSAIARAAASLTRYVLLADVGGRALARIAREAERRQGITPCAWRATVRALGTRQHPRVAAALRVAFTRYGLTLAADT